MKQVSSHLPYALPKEFRPRVRRWPSRKLTVSPIWCAVDLRDGNQALPQPLTPAQKLSYFEKLVSIGYKEIEIGFPAASQDDWGFCRLLIEGKKIPADVTISVLSQARSQIINKTIRALQDVPRAIFHLYVPTSDLHREFVLKESREEMVQRVRESVKAIRRWREQLPNQRKIQLEFSPEEFTDSDLDFVVPLCDKVVEDWSPLPGEKVIINLPCTVERALPLHYADMVEAFAERSKQRKKMILSLHAHNDMGTGNAAVELGLLAGGERVEGTLFGNGERSGNADLVTLALNLESLGVPTGLDFSHLEKLSAEIEALTSMTISPRQPYAGALVFSAFSGSHQDAIRKCERARNAICRYFGGWKMPYLNLDPATIGRACEAKIRINSQSGRGGIAYVLEQNYGIHIPDAMLAELAQDVQKKADKTARELRAEEVWGIFLRDFDCQDGAIRLINYWPRPDRQDPTKIQAEVHLLFQEEPVVLRKEGDGPVAAFANALRQLPIPAFHLLNYEERSIGASVDAEAITIVSLEQASTGKTFYGIGFGANIVQGAARAMISGINRMMK